MLRNLGTLSLLLLLATPLVAVAQNTGKLSGRVVDDLGDPLPGANVILSGTQLGAATDIDGSYFVIGVPVGTYDITASFVGYDSQTITGVQISTGYTTEQNFELGSDISLGAIEITYERPIIQKDAIGVPRVVSGEDIENLPIRGVANVAAIQGGVVNNGSSDDLFIRGGRNEEVAYYVDGVKVSTDALVGVNQQAIAEQEILIGTIPARYGDVQSGVISITTKSGGANFFGSAEAITSEVLDAYGYNIGSLSIGGPIIANRASFFLSGQGSWIADSNPYGTDTYRLTDDAYANLVANPQVLQLECLNPSLCGDGVELGDFTYLNFPWQVAADSLAAGGDFSQEDLRNMIAGDIPGGYAPVLDSNGRIIPISAPDTYTADRFELARGKDDPLRELTFNGNTTFDISSALSLRIGGGYESRDREERGAATGFSNSLYNRDAFYNDQRDSWRLYGTFRQRLTGGAFYQIQGEYQDWQYVQYPEGFSDDVRDALFYGDVNNEALALTQRYFRNVGQNYVRDYTSDGIALTSSAVSGITFNLPGSPVEGTRNLYQQGHNTSLRFSGSATAQVGLHQLEFGGEFQQEQQRFYSLSGNGLSRFYNDNNPEQLPAGDPGVTRYEDLSYTAFDPRVFYYGYDFRGLGETDDQDIDAFFARDSTGTPLNPGIAPYEPIYYAGYIQDKIEYRDLVINLGVRVDVFDNNTLQLFDVYSPVAIVRAGGIDGVPAGIGSDYAVYYDNNGEGNNIVGYRDLDGNFYDASGSQARQTRITDQLQGQVRRATDAEGNELPRSAGFEDYTPQVTFMPRVGVSFPVTDRALFFASYNVTSQRPTERAYAPFRTFEELGPQSSRTANPGLKPEQTTQYELGFRQRVGERAAVTISGFYRTQENKISNFPLNGGFPAYGTYLNRDFTTTKGAEFGFDLRRTANLALNLNYTLSFAQGTGSDATATANIVWRGTFFPNFISAADFDQRHTINGSVDYRLGDSEGPMIAGARPLENFGVNLLAQYGSGTPYTPLVSPGNFAGESFTSNAAGIINGTYLPSSFRLDLKVDRRFDLGFAGTQAKIYLTVLNLLDTQNVLAVYRATGLAGYDAYLNTPGGAGFVNSLSDPRGAEFNYLAFAEGPVNVGGNQTSGGAYFYGQPRQVRLGVLLNF